MNECVYGGDESLTPGHVTGLTHTHTHTHCGCGSHGSAGWRSGSDVCRMNEVILRQARLVLGWVTVFRRVYHLGI